MRAIIFNNKNLLKFAANLYYDDGKYEHYMPLCTSTMYKANGEIIHCITGELYERFVGEPIGRRITKQDFLDEDIPFRSKSNWRNNYNQIVDCKAQSVVFIAENYAIDDMLKVARLHRSSVLRCVKDDFVELMVVNDGIAGNSEQRQIRRAKAVQKALVKIANDHFV